MNYYSAIGAEVQEVHSRQGMCDSFDANKYRDFSLDMRILDPDDGRKYGGEVVGDYETVENYFNYHGETWWDGEYSPGYEEAARLAGQVPPGLSAHYAGTGSGAEVGFAGADGLAVGEARPTAHAAPTNGSGERGACGFPIYDEPQRAGQDVLAKMGRCDEYTGPKG